MKAMIFAAGLGTRLKPWTDSHPKALAPVNSRAVMFHVMDNLQKSGAISEFIVNVHSFADQVEEALASEAESRRWKYRISDERSQLLETGGGLLKARPLLESDEPVVIHNADILTDLDIDEMATFHVKEKADVSLLAMNRNSSRYLFFDKNSNLLQGWMNVKTGQRIPENSELSPDNCNRYAFGGIHIVSPTIFPLLEEFNFITNKKKEADGFSLIPFYLWARDKIRIMPYSPSKPFRWFDIGTPENLHAANISFNGQ